MPPNKAAGAPAPAPVAKPAPPPIAAVAKTAQTYADELVRQAKTLLAAGTSVADHTRAASLLEQAAAADNATAMILLADLYWRADGVAHDAAHAERLLRASIGAGGDPLASFALGQIYADEDGDIHDTAKAKAMFKASADLAYPPAMVALARILVDEHSPASSDLARTLLQRAIAAGQQASGGAVLGDLYLDDAGGADVAKAAAAYEQAANAGSAYSALRLATLLMAGKTIKPDYPKAAKLFDKAVSSGQTIATADWIAAGDLFLQADKPEFRSAPRAVTAFDKASSGGNSLGMIKLAQLYLAGEAPTIDRTRMVMLLGRAIEKGAKAPGGLALGDILSQGPDADPVKAAAAYQIAADAGNSDAMMKLARIYNEGRGVTASKETALALAKEALAAGVSSEAWELVGDIYVNFSADEDRPAAIVAYGKAADARRAGAMVKLARLVAVQAGDELRVRALVEKAVAGGEAKAAWGALGEIYANPAIKFSDPAKAAEAFRHGVEAGDAYSMLRLGEMLSDGRSLPVDFKRAVDLLNGAVKDGLVADAAERLGELYQKAPRPLGSPAKALAAYSQAAEAGSGIAHLKVAAILSAQGAAPAPGTRDEIVRHYREAARLLGARRAAVAMFQLDARVTVAIAQELLQDAGFKTPVTGNLRGTSPAIQAFCAARKLQACESEFLTVAMVEALLSPGG